MIALHKRKLLKMFWGFILFLVCGAISGFAYTSSEAVNYANDNWNKRNSEYNDYGKYDCTNFVSQCLIDGGLNLEQDDDIPSGHIDEYGAVVNCDSLNDHLEDFQHAEVTQGTSVNNAPANLGSGDVVIFGDANDNYRHATLVISGSGANVKLAAHSNNQINVDLNFYINDMISKYSNASVAFYHFPTATERGHNQEFYGTGDYYGPSTLIFQILGPTRNYEGYIVDCDDNYEQDLVVGEDTSQYTGCAWYIKAYCSDAHKSIPDDGVDFGQPWTSNDPNHWAYWARKAVQYANQNNHSSRDTLEAIWYITDRSGYYNDILVNIGYSQNGPDKNINGYQESIESNSIKLINNKFNPMKNESVSILYNITSSGAVTIKIYTIEGALVKTVLNDVHQAAGIHTETWDGLNDNWGIVASGIYLVHIEGPGLRSTKKLCIIK